MFARQFGDRIADPVRGIGREPRPLKGCFEKLGSPRSRGPWFPRDALRLEAARGANADAGLREQGDRNRKTSVPAEARGPSRSELPRAGPDGKEGGREHLAELGVHVAPIKGNAAVRKVHVAELELDRRALTRPSQEEKRDQRAISPLDDRVRRHRRDDVPNLVRSRVGLPQCAASRLLGLAVWREVVGIGMADLRLVAWLVGQPVKEGLQIAQSGTDRAGGQWRPGAS